MQLDKFQGRNVQISEGAIIGANVSIGDNCVVYDNVVIGDNSVICNDCIIGEPLSSYYQNRETYINPTTTIGSGALIRSHTIIYAGNVIGDDFQTGHRVVIREGNQFGSHCSVGTFGDIQGFSKFGSYVRLHSNVHVGQHSRIGNYCWIYPYTVFTNDPTPPSDICEGPIVGDYSVIATHCLLLPGVSIGKHCLVGAYSMVSKDMEDYKVAIGAPARIVKDVRDIRDRETGISHYPWPLRFDRGMPWKDLGYLEWLKKNSEE